MQKVKVQINDSIVELTGFEIKKLCQEKDLVELKDYKTREIFLVPLDKVESIEKYRCELSNSEVYRDSSYSTVLNMLKNESK